MVIMRELETLTLSHVAWNQGTVELSVRTGLAVCMHYAYAYALSVLHLGTSACNCYRSGFWVSSSIDLYLLLFQTCSLIEPEAHRLAMLAGQQDLRLWARAIVPAFTWVPMLA